MIGANKARKKANSLNLDITSANDFRARSFENRAGAIDTLNDQNIMANFFGDGGSTNTPDVQFGNLHVSSIFTPSKFNLAKNGAVQGKFKVPFKPGFRAFPIIDATSGLIQTLGEEKDIRNSDNPDMTRKQFEFDNAVKRSKMIGTPSPKGMRPRFFAPGGPLKASTPLDGFSTFPERITGKVKEKLNITKPIVKLADSEFSGEVDWYDQYFDKRLPVLANNIFNPTNDPGFNPSEEDWNTMLDKAKKYKDRRMSEVRDKVLLTWNKDGNNLGTYYPLYKLIGLHYDKKENDPILDIVGTHEIGHAIQDVGDPSQPLMSNFALKPVVEAFTKANYKRPERVLPKYPTDPKLRATLIKNFEANKDKPDYGERLEEQLSFVWEAKRAAEKLGMVKDAALHNWGVEDIRALRKKGFLRELKGYTDEDLVLFFNQIAENIQAPKNQTIPPLNLIAMGGELDNPTELVSPQYRKMFPNIG